MPIHALTGDVFMAFDVMELEQVGLVMARSQAHATLTAVLLQEGAELTLEVSLGGADLVTGVPLTACEKLGATDATFQVDCPIGGRSESLQATLE